MGAMAYRITSSAWKRTVGEMVRPRARVTMSPMVVIVAAQCVMCQNVQTL
jgi:hypothetical protein